VQEALNNAAKHARTKRAEVRLHFGSRDLTVHVTDFGQGLPAAKKNERVGLGLIAMRERADLVNGRLTVSSSPGIGTTISIKMPLDQEETLAETATTERIGEVIKPLYE
jgi:two-component system sensor histidine kinase DegS